MNSVFDTNNHAFETSTLILNFCSISGALLHKPLNDLIPGGTAGYFKVIAETNDIPIFCAFFSSLVLTIETLTINMTMTQNKVKALITIEKNVFFLFNIDFSFSHTLNKSLSVQVHI